MEAMTTTIDATQIVKRAFPPEEGAALAQTLLAKSDTDWSDLVIDLRALPSSLLISAFFNSFLQTIYQQQPTLLERARKIRWEVKFPFQRENVTDWMKKFEPFVAT